MARLPFIMTSKSMVWFASIVAFSACSHDFQLMRMEEQVNGYGAAIRWNQCSKALTYLDRPEAVVSECEKFRDVRVTLYQIVSRNSSLDGKTMTQIAEIHYVPASGVIEKRLQDQQAWRLDENRKRWLLETGLPSLDPAVSQTLPVR